MSVARPLQVNNDSNLTLRMEKKQKPDMNNTHITVSSVNTPPPLLSRSKRFGIGRHALTALMFFIVVLEGMQAEASIEQVRQEYHEARVTFRKTRDYGKDYRESVASAHALIAALLNQWLNLPEHSGEVSIVCREIKTVLKDTAGNRFTERYPKEKSFLARTLWPLLSESKPTSRQANFMAQLIKPQKGINFYDLLSRLGQPTEPLGWDVQVTYALALIRSGNDKQARKRINLLHRKVSINHTHNPKGSLDYGPEAGTGRYRDYVHYLQLCEVLHALRAAVSNDHTSARKHIENARKHREPLSPEAAPLVAEIVLRIEEQKD